MISIFLRQDINFLQLTCWAVEKVTKIEGERRREYRVVDALAYCGSHLKLMQNNDQTSSIYRDAVAATTTNP